MNSLLRYFQESWLELKKVTWPTRNQALRLTAIVLVTVFVASLLFALFDYLFNLGFTYLLSLPQ